MAKLLEHKGFLDAITIRVVGKWEASLQPSEELWSEEFELKENEECFYAARITNTETFIPIEERILPEANSVGVTLEYKSYRASVRIHAYNKTLQTVNLRVTVLGVTRA